MSYSNLYVRIYDFRNQSGRALARVFKFYPARFYLVAIIALQLIAWLQSLLIKRSLTGDLLVLHYNVDFGVDLVGAPGRVFIYPLIGLCLVLVNIILAAISYRRDNHRVLFHLFLGGAAAFNLFAVLSLLSLYLINFR